MSYDILAVINSAKKVYKLYNDTVEKVEDGIDDIKVEYKDLCQNFVDLTKNVDQEYLNKINTNFKNIIKIVN